MLFLERAAKQIVGVHEIFEIEERTRGALHVTADIFEQIMDILQDRVSDVSMQVVEEILEGTRNAHQERPRNVGHGVERSGGLSIQRACLPVFSSLLFSRQPCAHGGRSWCVRVRRGGASLLQPRASRSWPKTDDAMQDLPTPSLRHARGITPDDGNGDGEHPWHRRCPRNLLRLGRGHPQPQHGHHNCSRCCPVLRQHRRD